MDFTLTPFRENDFIKCIDGEIIISAAEVRCRYRLVADMDWIVWPASMGKFDRQMDLWKHTCFEFFLGMRNDLRYFEFNLSPSGNWNSFAFSNFRKDMKQTDAMCLRTVQVTDATSQKQLSAIIDIVGEEELYGILDIGVCAVIEDVHGWHNYYALAHGGDRPDFHRRETHLISYEM